VKRFSRAVKLFPTKDEAEEMLGRVLEDEPDWRDVLRVERLELGSESPN
jgi:hypothetical protein